MENKYTKLVEETLTEGKAEFVIWGVPPKKKDEELLVANVKGKPLTDKKQAQHILDVLTDKYGITKGRIQTIDFKTDPNFLDAI